MVRRDHVWVSVTTIATLAIPRRAGIGELPAAGVDVAAVEKPELGRVLRDLKEGFEFIRSSGVERAVLIGPACGVAGGGTVVPLGPVFSTVVLGPVFSTVVLHSGPSGFAVLLTAFGLGVASGVLVVSLVQHKLPHPEHSKPACSRP